MNHLINFYFEKNSIVNMNMIFLTQVVKVGYERQQDFANNVMKLKFLPSAALKFPYIHV